MTPMKPLLVGTLSCTSEIQPPAPDFITTARLKIWQDAQIILSVHHHQFLVSDPTRTCKTLVHCRFYNYNPDTQTYQPIDNKDSSPFTRPLTSFTNYPTVHQWVQAQLLEALTPE